MQQHYFRVAWASSGDRASVPAADATGAVNYSDGWGADYQKNKQTDPTARSIERDAMNGVLFDITNALASWQVGAFPEWISAADNGGAALAYDAGTVVRWRASTSDPWKLYQSQIDANTTSPGDGVGVTQWALWTWRIATDSEMTAGTPSNNRIVTPANLRTYIAGNYFGTPPVFNAVGMLATTYFVQRALGNRAGYSWASAALSLDDVGRRIVVGVNSTLPDAALCPAGAVLHFTGSTAAITLSPFSAGQMRNTQQGVIPNQSLLPGETVEFTRADSAVWDMTGGSVALLIASTAEAQAGTDTRKFMTPKRVAEAIAAQTSAFPTGGVTMFPANVAPAGWLELAGQLINRADYPLLWTYAQTTGNLVSEATWSGGSTGAFSTGDTTTTFRLPETRGEFIRGWDHGRGVDASRGIGTAQGHLFASHGHAASSDASGYHGHSAWTDTQGWHGHGVSDPGHSHFGGLQTFAGGGQGASGSPNFVNQRWIDNSGTGIGINGDGNHAHNVGIGGDGSHSHTINITANGGTETRPRNVPFMFCIKT